MASLMWPMNQAIFSTKFISAQENAVSQQH